MLRLLHLPGDMGGEGPHSSAVSPHQELLATTAGPGG